jgi:hypothetical protein
MNYSNKKNDEEKNKIIYHFLINEGRLIKKLQVDYVENKKSLNEIENNNKNLEVDYDKIKKIIYKTFQHQNTLLKKEARNKKYKDELESIIQENLTFLASFDRKDVYDILSTDSTKSLENFLNNHENLEDLKASLLTVEELKKRYLNISKNILKGKNEKENIEKNFINLKELENTYEEYRKSSKNILIFKIVIRLFILVR